MPDDRFLQDLLPELRSHSLHLLLADWRAWDFPVLRQRFTDCLPVGEQARLAGLQREDSARMFLIGRALLRGSLAGLLGCEPARVVLQTNAWDKPELPPETGWHFNLSHSGGCAVLALSRLGPLGVDVESQERRNDLSRLAQRYFSAREQMWLAEAAPGENWRQRFFDIWTLKEAYIKAVGRGLAVTLEGFGFTEAEAGRLDYRYQGGEPAPAPVHAWLCRAWPGRPLACVGLGEGFAGCVPKLVCVDADGQAQGCLPVAASC